MTNSTSNDSADTGLATPAADLRWPTPDPTVPLEQLNDRELIARAEYCDEVAHTASPAARAAALSELDAAWDEAERRAADQPPVSVPAKVAGYIGLVREDYDHALASETATWRHQLDAALPPSERVLDASIGRRVATELDLAIERAAVDDRPTASTSDGLGTGDWDTAPAIAERNGHVVFDPNVPGGFRALTADEHQVLVDNARPSQVSTWSADQHEAYLDSRPDGGLEKHLTVNPVAEYGDTDWREPASDDEAAARTAHIRDHFPPALGWAPRPVTEVEDAIEDAAERAVLSDRAHDHDPYAWAEYERLLALDSLAPLPIERDALDDLHDDPGQQARHEDTHLLREQPALGVTTTPTTTELTNVEDIRCGPFGPAARELGAESGVEIEAEQRREQLNRWHDDDRSALETAEADRGDGDAGDDGAAGALGPGWGR